MRRKCRDFSKKFKASSATSNDFLISIKAQTDPHQTYPLLDKLL